MSVQYKIKNNFSNSHNEIMIHETEALDLRAEFACKLLSHLAVVAAEIDGEDSAGRSKIRLMTPAELAQRACAIAQLSFEQFEMRGWIVRLPGIEALDPNTEDK